MKKYTLLPALVLMICILWGCSAPREYAPIAATTLPVYEFTSRLCQGTDLTVTRLVTENVSCLHDYSLNVSQVRSAEAAQLVVINGAGLEEFMDDILRDADSIDASSGIEIIEFEEGRSHDHDHDHDHSQEEKPEDHSGHHHEFDSHIWLSPVNAMAMVRNIHSGLCAHYPQYADTFDANLKPLLEDLERLYAYGEEQLAELSCRDIITFHDGFSYFAQCYDLHIIRAVEEESGAEASAAELIELIEEVEHHNLPAIFTETNGSTSAADVISRETGAAVYTLDMAMAGDSWFDAMYRNIDTMKEALG
ncbi:MAG: zinc ABC transporter substrate-binding protein [Oscillospiraceae bacterium]|nr:zinc ABC transporter substrate-binding protein [Oscillospiraceae bacterium]